MKNEPTKSCTYCGSPAHSTRSCYVKAAGLPSLAQIAKAQRQADRDAAKAAKEQAKADKIAAKAAAAAEKERIKAEKASRSRISCSYCGRRGHTRAACELSKSDIVNVTKFVSAARAIYWETVKGLQYGIGSFVTYSGYGYYIPSAEYKLDNPNSNAEWCGWSGNASNKQEVQMVTGFTLTADWRRPIKMHTMPIPAVGTGSEPNDINLPIVGDYFTGSFKHYWVGNSAANRNECFLSDWERFFNPAGATTIENSVDADALASWLAATDVKKWTVDNAPRKSGGRGWGRQRGSKGYNRPTFFSQFDIEYLRKYVNLPDHVLMILPEGE